MEPMTQIQLTFAFSLRSTYSTIMIPSKASKKGKLLPKNGQTHTEPVTTRGASFYYIEKAWALTLNESANF